MIDFENGLELSVILHKKQHQILKSDTDNDLVNQDIFILELADDLRSDKFLGEIKEELFVMQNQETGLIEAEFLAYFGSPIFKNLRLCFLQPMDYFNDWHFLIMTSEAYEDLDNTKKEFQINILSREEEEKITELGNI